MFMRGIDGVIIILIKNQHQLNQYTSNFLEKSIHIL